MIQITNSLTEFLNKINIKIIGSNKFHEEKVLMKTVNSEIKLLNNNGQTININNPDKIRLILTFAIYIIV